MLSAQSSGTERRVKVIHQETQNLGNPNYISFKIEEVDFLHAGNPISGKPKNQETKNPVISKSRKLTIWETKL